MPTVESGTGGELSTAVAIRRQTILGGTEGTPEEGKRTEGREDRGRGRRRELQLHGTHGLVGNTIMCKAFYPVT